MSVALVGSTGLIGSNILKLLPNLDTVHKVYAFSRKEIPANPKLQPIISSDSANWASQYPAEAQLFISALGTTRAVAGGFENQKKIDLDLNIDLAKAAQAAGTKSYVLISSSGANVDSSLGYPQLKGQIEEEIKALGFDHVVILRPGLIVGDRNESRMAEFALRKIASFAGSVSHNKLKDFWAQDADVIAKAAVRAGLDCVEGKQTEKVRMLTQADIVRMGRTEWSQTS